MVKTIVILTFGIELIGALLLLPVFCVHYGASGIFKAVFTSVSSFCNAGFDIISLTHIAGSSAGWYISYVFVTLTLSALVVFGGLGFTVLVDILKQKRFKRLSLHSKVVLVMTGILILAPFLFLFGFEFNNADTVGNLSLGEKLLASLFYSINLRSSGFNYFDFNHIDFSAMTPQSRAFSMLFMFIGASPCSMGGGIKTTTFAVLILIFFSGGRQDNEITLGRHALHKKIGYRAVSVLLYFMFLILTMTILILIFEQDNISNGILNTEKVLFESISAACSVGFSLGITASLTTASKLVLAAGMYLGRIGAVTAGLMLFRPQEKTLIQYPEGHLMVG